MSKIRRGKINHEQKLKRKKEKYRMNNKYRNKKCMESNRGSRKAYSQAQSQEKTLHDG